MFLNADLLNLQITSINSLEFEVVLTQRYFPTSWSVGLSIDKD